MNIEQASFNQLVQLAMQNSNVATMRPVVEKELLHYDILFCLERSGLLNNLVFQGGTSLRLCYGANRFSEDLDFAGGYEFDQHSMDELRSVVEKYVGQRYGLDVQVKEPKQLKQDPKYAELKINKWQIAIITAPEQKHLAKQRIKIEVANIPAYTKAALPLINNYTFLPDGYEDTLIYTESLEEVMADKLVSLPATQKYIRYRDIWDLVWLYQQGARVNAQLVTNKLNDYKLNNFEELLSLRLDSLASIISSSAFKEEMKRFIPTNIYQRTLGQEKFTSYLNQTLRRLLAELMQSLYGEPDAELEFEL